MDSLDSRKRRCLMYRRIAVLASVFALTAISAMATPASAGSASVRLSSTFTGAVTGGGAWCCGTFFNFEGSATVMGVGAVEFTGHRLAGCSDPLPLPTTCLRRLDLMLVARNGDQLAISGNNDWLRPVDPAPEVTTWIVDQTRSTGRFADFAASGTYTFELVDATAVVVTLSGVRQPADD
jgi:hypothetical protein